MEVYFKDMGVTGLADGQKEAYLKDIGMTGLASAWTMARWRPEEYRRKVDAATRCSGGRPIPDLTCHKYLRDSFRRFSDRPPLDATMKRVDAPSA